MVAILSIVGIVGLVAIVLVATLVVTLSQDRTRSPSVGTKSENPLPSPPAVAPPTASPGPTNPNVSSIRGERVVNQILGKYPMLRPAVAGGLTATTDLRIYVPRSTWNRLSTTGRASVALYAASLIPDVRANPSKYEDTPATAPAYKMIMDRTRQTCDECWEIIVGDIVHEDGETTMTVDESVVEGDSFWSQDEPCCRGMRASELLSRANSEGGSSPDRSKKEEGTK